MKKLVLAVLLPVLLVSGAVYACTALRIKADDGTIISARTMEFGLNVHNSIVVSPRGLNYTLQAPDGTAGIKWSNKYGFAAIDAFGDYRIVMDGMNEKGLSFSALWYESGEGYQNVSKSERSKSIAYTVVGSWILGNYSTAAEVGNALKTVRVYGYAIPGFGVVLPLHFIVTDASGGCIVVEYDKGELHVYDNPLGIMTNSPNFPWQLNNLRLYAGMTNSPEGRIDFAGMKQQTIGHGTGFLGLPGDYTPPSRFVKMAVLQHFAKPAKNAGEALNLAHHIINTVDIADGYIVDRDAQGKETASETTEWTVFRDLTNRVLYYYTYNNFTMRKVDLNKLDFTAKAPAHISLEAGTNYIEDVTATAK